MDNSEDRGQEIAPDAGIRDYVVVCFLDDIDQATEYQQLLEANDIPVQVEGKEASGSEESYVVMVPEQYLDEAHVLIESQVSYDDFYDFPLDEDGDSPYDDDLYEDEF